MAVESIALALHHSQAKGTTKLVLLGIANHDGDGGAWPSIATLRKYAGGVDERTVRRSIAELVALGEVAVDLNQGGTQQTRNDQRPNLYHVLLQCPATCDRSKNHRVDGGTPVSGRSVDEPVDNRSRGDVGVRNGGTPTSPEPSIEPSKSPFVVSHAVGGDVIRVDLDARSTARKACDQLADMIAANDPHGKRPTVTESWVVDMDRIHRIDGRPWADIKSVMEWSQQDAFWLANIKSPSKLRAKFATLVQNRDRKPNDRHQRDADFWNHEMQEAIARDNQTAMKQLVS